MYSQVATSHIALELAWNYIYQVCKMHMPSRFWKVIAVLLILASLNKHEVMGVVIANRLA